VDNIDESGRVELHGTAISMTSHVTADHPGEDMSPITISKPTRTAITIPDEIACVRHVEEVNGDIYVPRVDQPIEMVAVFNCMPRVQSNFSWNGISE
jgi:hypothetical protein